jgi:thiol-disulfide isomerase/thioredoxin
MKYSGFGRFSLGLCLAVAAVAAVANAPRPSPPFAIQRVGAPPLSIESLRGKIVLLALIDTNCSHCQDLTRSLGPIAKEYESRGVQVVECAFNEAAQSALPGFIKEFQPPFPVGYSNRAAVDAYLQRSVMDIRPLYVPHLVFLDRNGVIRGDYAGESDFMVNAPENIRQELDKLLSAAPAKRTKITKKTA